jgi:hypothetical protein
MSIEEVECPTDALLTKFGSYYEMSMDVKYDPAVETVTVDDDSVVHVIGGRDDMKYPNATASTMERGLRELFAYVGDKKKPDNRNVLPKALKKTKKQKNRPKSKNKSKSKRKPKSGGDESSDSDSEISISDSSDSSDDELEHELTLDNIDIIEEVEALAEITEIAIGASEFNLSDFTEPQSEPDKFNLSDFASDESN